MNKQQNHENISDLANLLLETYDVAAFTVKTVEYDETIDEVTQVVTTYKRAAINSDTFIGRANGKAHTFYISGDELASWLRNSEEEDQIEIINVIFA